MFERTTRAGRQFRPKRPANTGAADKTEETHSRVRYQRFGNFAVVRDNDLYPFLRQTGFAKDVDKANTRQRRVGGRFDDDRAAARNRGADLVHNQVERVIESTNSDDNANLEVTDAVFLLDHLFLGGPSPEPPFPTCGLEPTPDNLTCESFKPCQEP